MCVCVYDRGRVGRNVCVCEYMLVCVCASAHARVHMYARVRAYVCVMGAYVCVMGAYVHVRTARRCRS